MYLVFWQSSFPNLSWIEGIPIEFMSLLFSVAEVVKVNNDLQGVPKKTLVSVQRLLEALKNELQMKVG